MTDPTRLPANRRRPLVERVETLRANHGHLINLTVLAIIGISMTVGSVGMLYGLHLSAVSKAPVDTNHFFNLVNGGLMGLLAYLRPNSTAMASSSSTAEAPPKKDE